MFKPERSVLPSPEFAGIGRNSSFWHIVEVVLDERQRPNLTTVDGLTAAIRASERLRRHEAKFFGANSIATSLGARLLRYFAIRDQMLRQLTAELRTEDEARAALARLGIEPELYTTQSADHHQSPRAAVAEADHVAKAVAREFNLSVNTKPQRRCFFEIGEEVYATPRRLDGALPSLENPVAAWEIKEYWGGGKKPGGSKMSDAVYECALVGHQVMALNDLLPPARRVSHYALVDGRRQWERRISDLARLVDLLNRGLLDGLFVGTAIAPEFRAALERDARRLSSS